MRRYSEQEVSLIRQRVRYGSEHLVPALERLGDALDGLFRVMQEYQVATGDVPEDSALVSDLTRLVDWYGRATHQIMFGIKAGEEVVRAHEHGPVVSFAPIRGEAN